MASAFGEILEGFDLDFLSQTTSQSSSAPLNGKLEKLRKSLQTVKKKTVMTDMLIKKFYEKKEALEQAEKTIVESKLECKQICINYRKAVDRNAVLEQSDQKLQSIINELQEQVNSNDSSNAAIQIHTNQLQSLVKKYEQEFEAGKEKTKKSAKEKKIMLRHICMMKEIIFGRRTLDKQMKSILRNYISLEEDSELEIEDTIDNEAASWLNDNGDRENESLVKKNEQEIEAEKEKVKEATKKSATLEKEKKIMLRHICMMKEIIFGRRTLDKQMKSILRNYISLEEDSELEIEDTIDNEAASWLNDNGDRENEIISSCKQSGDDSTGYDDMTYKSSQNEICDIERNEYCAEITSSVDTGCGSSIVMSGSEKCLLSPEYNSSNDSPLSIELPTKVTREKSDAATSPMLAEVCDVATSPIRFTNSDNVIRSGTTPTREKPKHYVDSTTSPITEILDKEYRNIPNILINNSNDIPLMSTEENDVIHVKDVVKEKECLEINNSNKVCDNRNNDPEVSDILKTMSLHYDLITPLPPSPTVVSEGSQTETAHKCIEAAIAREENKQLQSKFAYIRKQLSELMSLMKNQNVKPLPLSQENAIIRRDKPSPEPTTTVHDVIENIEDHESDNYAALDNSSEYVFQMLDAKSCTSEVVFEKNRISNRISFYDPLPNNMEPSDVEINDDDSQILSKEKCCDINSKLDDRTNNNSVTRPKRKVKMTRLQKFKSKLLPKSKISSSVSKTRLRSRKPLQTPFREKVTLCKNDSSKTLNDESVYRKALAVVTELRANTKNKKERVLKRKGGNIGILDAERVPQKVLQTHTEIKDISVKSGGITTDVTKLDNGHEKVGLQEEIKQVNDQQPTPFPKRKVKMTRLQKFKSRLLPKSKISSSVSKTRLRSRKPLQTPLREKVTLCKNDSSKTLNDESVYRKALAVVTELRANTKNKKERVLKRKGGNIGILDEERVPQKVLQTHTEIKDISVKSFKISTDVTKLDNGHEKVGLQEEIKQVNDQQPTPFNTGSPNISKKLVTPTKIQRLSVENSSNNVVRTRSRSKINIEPIINEKMMNEKDNWKKKEEQPFKNCENNSIEIVSPSEPDKTPRKRKSSTQKSPAVETKRKLRSSSMRLSESQETEPNNDNLKRSPINDNLKRSPVNDNLKRSPIVLARKLDMNSIEFKIKAEIRNIPKDSPSQGKVHADYGDLDLFTNSCENVPEEESTVVPKKNSESPKNRNKITEDAQIPVSTPKDSVLCRMIQKYGKSSRRNSKKISEKQTTEVFNKIDGSMRNIMALPPNETKQAMNRLVNDLKELEFKPFMAGLMKYLKEPERKTELLGKVFVSPAPPMSKSEHILLYVISQLKSHWRSVDLVEELMRNVEYALFKLNCTPDFDVIESMSHLYAVLCRYSRNKNRLRLFMLDAMYCITYKSIPLIRQCIDVWMHVLPLAHMGIAKSPMIVCLVYLLHFYRCEDKFKRVQDIRQILHRKYSYDFSEWNEKKILEMLKNWIMDVKSLQVEKKMLRLTLIILAKRQGARWCEKNIIKNLLLPLIEDQSTPEPVRVFCISTLGPLLRPFPNDMKVHCEVVLNQLMDMLDQNLSPVVEEAVYTSLVYMNRHNQLRVNEALLKWKPQREVPKNLDNLLRNYVREKPIRAWKLQLKKLWLKEY